LDESTRTRLDGSMSVDASMGDITFVYERDGCIASTF
jgi:hypothetical protein